MEILLSYNGFNIHKTNNLILGVSKDLKTKLIQKFVNINARVIDKNFSFSTSLVKEQLENYSIKTGDYPNLKRIINKQINDLSIEEKYYLMLILKMPFPGNVYVIDEVLTYLNKTMKADIFNYVKNNDIYMIYFTQVIEDDYFFDGYLTFYMDDKVAISGPAKTILIEDKIIKRLGYKLPFAVDLSNQLKLYNMINKTCFNVDELVGELWK